MIEHRNVLNLALNTPHLFGDGVSRTLLSSPYTLDHHAGELYSCLLNKGTAVLAPDNICSDALNLGDFILDHDIHFAIIPGVLVSRWLKEVSFLRNDCRMQDMAV